MNIISAILYALARIGRTATLVVFLLISYQVYGAMVDNGERFSLAEGRLHSSPEKLYDLAQNELARINGKGMPRLEAKWLHLLGRACVRLGKDQEALDDFNRSLILAEKNDDDLLVIDIVLSIGDMYRLAKDYENADIFLARGLRLANQTDDYARRYEAEIILGHRYSWTDHFDLSEKHYKNALNNAMKADSTKLVVNVYRALGQLYKRNNQFELAIDYNDKAIQLLKNGEQPEMLAIILDFQATNYRKLERYAEALESAKKSLRIQRELGNVNLEARVLLNLSIIYRKLGNYDAALETSTRLLDIHSQSQNLNGMAAASNAIGLIYFRLGEYEHSRAFYESTLLLDSSKIKVKYRATAFREIAHILNVTDKNEQALAYAQHAKTLHKNASGLTAVYRILGEIYRSMGKVDESRKAYLQALSISEKNKSQWNQSIILIRLAELELEGNAVLAKKYLQQGFDIAQAISAKPRMRDAYAVFVELEKNAGDFEKAIFYADKKATLIEEINIERATQQTAGIKVVRNIERREREANEVRHREKSAELERIRKQSKVNIELLRDTLNRQMQRNDELNARLRFIVVMSLGLIVGLLASLWQVIRLRRKLNVKNG